MYPGECGNLDAISIAFAGVFVDNDKIGQGEIANNHTEHDG